MSDFVDLGRQHYVRAADVVAVGDGANDTDKERMAISPGGMDAKAVVLLRSGSTIPA